jgi:transglutaminase-like putative cysteine protease
MRFDIRYSCRFTYDQLVRESQNELRACPLSDDFQHLTSYRVQTVPSSRVLSFHDWWGTRVDAFGVREPHLVLDVVAEAVVETYPRPMLATDPRASLLVDTAFRDQHAEYLERTPHANWGPEIAAAAARQVEIGGPGIVSQVLGLHRFVGSQLRYEPGTTYVGVDVDEVFERGAGVCQDFAHLAIALCRAAGIPARYVSGYLFTVDERSGEEGEADVVQVQTHAWMEAAVPGLGWIALDPTNGLEVGMRHVAIGRGRDYDDVPPLRGVYAGEAAHELDVQVSIRRVSAPPPVPPVLGADRSPVVARREASTPPPARGDDGRLQHQPLDHRQQQQQQQQQG